MKKQILLVDDTPLLLEAHVCMLEGEPGRWEVETADGGEDALKRMEEKAFDVIVSDFEMPGMDGIALINEVKKRHPGTARVILSGITDQEKIVNCLQDTHQFIAKPVRAETLKDALSRICALDSYLKDEQLQALVNRLGRLPNFPRVYIDVVRELDSEEPSVDRIAEIAGRDPGMMAKVLQIANSAAFGLGHEVTSLAEAVQHVGMGTMRSLALSAHVYARSEQAHFKGLSVAHLWEHGLRTAALARVIMRCMRAETDEVEDAYTAAMLHDIGKLLLACGAPDDYERAANLRSENDLSASQAEQEVFGADHAGVGAYLLGLWGLPARIVEAVAFHHTPATSEAKVVGPVAAVHIANSLEHELSATPLLPHDTELDMEYLESVGVADQLPVFRERAKRMADAHNA